jgi:hypothetical protein
MTNGSLPHRPLKLGISSFSVRIPLTLLCIVSCSTGSLAQQQANVEIQPKVVFVTMLDKNLQWAGQESTTEDELAEITLRNVGQESITGFQLGWVLFIPEGCGVREVGVPRSEVHMAPYREGTILPGQSVVIGAYHLSSKSIIDFARHAHSPAVVVQAGIVRVRVAGRGESIYPLEERMRFADEAAAYPCEAYQKAAEAENALKTFSGAEFSFQYASLLIPCEKKEQQTGDGYYWMQSSCSAYFPVCDDDASPGSDTIVCIAYPREKFADAPTFEAAAFSVAAISGVRSEKECQSGSPDWPADWKNSNEITTINQIRFKVFEVGEAGMSQGVGGQVYRTFHENKCYQLSIRMANANGASFDGDIVEFTKEDFNEVRKRLEQARDSFRFVK